MDVLKHAQMVREGQLLSRSSVAGSPPPPEAGALLITDGEFACRGAASSKSFLEEDIETRTFLHRNGRQVLC